MDREMETLFGSIFRQNIDETKMNSLTQQFGHTKVLDVLNYLLINPPGMARKKNNPYGLVYYLCKNGIKSGKRKWR